MTCSMFQDYYYEQAELEDRKEAAMYSFLLDEEKKRQGYSCFNGTVNQGTALSECNQDTCPF